MGFTDVVWAGWWDKRFPSGLLSRGALDPFGPRILPTYCFSIKILLKIQGLPKRKSFGEDLFPGHWKSKAWAEPNPKSNQPPWPKIRWFFSTDKPSEESNPEIRGSRDEVSHERKSRWNNRCAPPQKKPLFIQRIKQLRTEAEIVHF